MLGNVQTIANYAGNNIYKYLQMYILYCENRDEIWGRDWLGLATEYCVERQKLVSDVAPELLPEHRYLLAALQTGSYHSLHQLSLAILPEWPARLLCTLYFHFGLP